MNEALAYIDKSLDNVAGLDPETAWTNVEVVEVLEDIRSLLVTGKPTPGRFEQAHTPTDDEREAMLAEADRWPAGLPDDPTPAASPHDLIARLAAALRRTAVPEPSAVRGEPTDVPDGNGHHWMSWSESGKNGTYCRNCGGWAGKVGNRACEDAQGEPTDAERHRRAQTQARIHVDHEPRWNRGQCKCGAKLGDSIDWNWHLSGAALRAAYETKGEAG